MPGARRALICTVRTVSFQVLSVVVTEFHSYYSFPIFTVGSGVSGPSGIVSPALAIELRPDQAPFLVCNSRLVMHGSYTCSASLAVVALLKEMREFYEKPYSLGKRKSTY